LKAYRSGDWKKIPIKENGQSLVKVPGEISFPFYSRIMKIVKDEGLYLREEVLDKVFNARKLLQSQGFEMMVYDGWRSIELQENLFWYYMSAFTVDKFGLRDNFNQSNSPKEVKIVFDNLSPELQAMMIETNRTYVSWPSKDMLSPSPHTTGGAVDVWMLKDGLSVNLGVPFDWMEDNAGAFYHLKYRRKRFLGNDRNVCKNREVLLLAMTKAGFSCYGPEIWHFNYGNQMDALVRGCHAQFSYIEP
jgi:D-alanyl-D-alanine dipeptidase